MPQGAWSAPATQSSGCRDRQRQIGIAGIHCIHTVLNNTHLISKQHQRRVHPVILRLEGRDPRVHVCLELTHSGGRGGRGLISRVQPGLDSILEICLHSANALLGSQEPVIDGNVIFPEQLGH